MAALSLLWLRGVRSAERVPLTVLAAGCWLCKKEKKKWKGGGSRARAEEDEACNSLPRFVVAACSLSLLLFFSF